MTRQLPNDYARCNGVFAADSVQEESGTLADGCLGCLRRTSPLVGVSEGWYFAPPASFAVNCPERIPEDPVL